jgi:deoxyribonuclease-4
MSIGGGMHRAIQRAIQAGCATMQVFTKNSNRWSARPYTAGEIAEYREAAARSGVAPVLAHATYLINLCARDPDVLTKSQAAFTDELSRCESLGIRGLIVHPGSHGGAGEREGIRRIADSLNATHELTPGVSTLTVLETTAGQGTSLGYRFEQLADIIDRVDDRGRMAVCIDTCHVYAAGYDIAAEDGWDSIMKIFENVIGLQRLAAVHVNDSRRELDSRVDRHHHIGKGKIGLGAFRHLMNDRRLDLVPKIIETEKSSDMHEDVENMNVLRSLIAGRRQSLPTGQEGSSDIRYAGTRR